MTRQQVKTDFIDVKALISEDGNYLRTMVQSIVEATLEAVGSSGDEFRGHDT